MAEQGGELLLERWVEGGQRVRHVPTVAEMRAWRAEALAKLPESAHRFHAPERMEVRPTMTLQSVADRAAASRKK